MEELNADLAAATGTLFGVGVGPGDPELLTLKAVRVLASCPVIAAPQTGASDTLALDIVSQVVDLAGKEVLRLPFAMVRDAAQREERYGEAVARIEEHLRAGRDVALVNLGDVSVYATFGYIAERVTARGYAVEAVAGVPSFCAVAARLGESLTTMGEPLCLVPGGAMPVSEALALPGTKVLMKTGSQLGRVLEALDREGLLPQSALVRDCGLPTEGAWRGDELRELARDPQAAGYFATLVVRG